MVISKKLVALWVVMMIIAAVAARAADPVFYWGFETDAPDIFKTDNTPRWYADGTRSDSAAYAGTYSMRNQGEWALVMFDNPTLTDEWCPVSEGSFEFYWQYRAPWDGKMIFQITGKDVSGLEDTNDGFSVRLRGNTEGQFTAGLGWHNDADSTWQTRTLRSRTVTMVEGQWYRFRVRYKAGTGISMQIDDGAEELLSDALGQTRCTAWHHLLLGNDTYATGLQYIDEFRVWDTWEGVYDTSSTAILPVKRVSAENSRDITRITIYNGLGATVETIHELSLPKISQPVRNNPAVPAGMYFYRIETASGIRTGSFIKTD